MKKYTRKLKYKKHHKTLKKRGGGWPWSTTTQPQTTLTRQNGSRNLLRGTAQNMQRKTEEARKAMVNKFVAQSGQDPNEKIGPY